MLKVLLWRLSNKTGRFICFDSLFEIPLFFVVLPELGHFHEHKGRGPGYQGESGDSFHPGSESDVAKGFDVSVTDSGVIGKGKIHAVNEAAVEVALQGAEVTEINHEIEGYAE